MRVALREDNELAAQTLEKQLRKLGHTVERVSDIAALLSIESQFIPDIIITDIFMPGIEGLEFIKILQRSRLSEVPIIAISGGGDYMGGIPNIAGSFVSLAAISFGAKVFIQKPISLESLEMALLEASSGSR